MLTWREPTLMDQFCKLMIDAVSYRDPTTKAHSINVRGLAIDLANELGAFTEEMLQILGWAALLHDMGKLAIADTVLNKGKALTDAEWGMMRQHTNLGYRLICELGMRIEIPEVVLFHHENYDGSGYPKKLRGEDIPFLARIIRVVDTFESLTEFRSYRAIHEYSPAEALAMMQARPEPYDPFLLQGFARMIEARQA
jgi:putative nucleotidyltransferase with HDIG domain